MHSFEYFTQDAFSSIFHLLCHKIVLMAQKLPLSWKNKIEEFELLNSKVLGH